MNSINLNSNNKSPRLGVNLDHIATVRQARGETYPDLIRATDIALKSKADQITIHLREDRRHIQDADVPGVRKLTRQHQKLMNLEMAATEEMTQIALETNPDWVCLVPEKRQEVTTEGGLNLNSDSVYKNISDCVAKLRDQKIKVSLFVECDETILNLCDKLGVEAVEIHTGEYARAFNRGEVLDSWKEKFSQARRWYPNGGIHAGHGLTRESVRPLLEWGLFAEYNIGHWIISEALFEGLGNVIQDLHHSFQEYPLCES